MNEIAKRQNIASGSPWEDKVGYSRAVRVGQFVQISGTTATIGGKVQGVNDPYWQTCVVLQLIQEALAQAGARLEDVVRTRIYVTNIAHWPEIGRAHAEVFGKIRPTTSMVQVVSLIDPLHLLEIEAEAIVGQMSY